MSSRWPLFAVVLAACVPDAAPPDPVEHDEWDDKLAARVIDYNAALRISALRLTGDLPTLDEIESVATAGDPKSVYEAQIHTYIASPKFAKQMFRYWQDTLMVGGDPDLDQAPAFAAKLTVDGGSYQQLFIATQGTCPTINSTTFQVTPANCANGTPTHAGILTNPAVQAHLFSNFAFRRVRWVQETFACTKFPAELALAGKDVGGATPYTGNFLFAHYDAAGQYQTALVVPTPLPMMPPPPAVRLDYLPATEQLAWRYNTTPINDNDLPSLGHEIANDPQVSQCAVARVWNWALGKADIVDGGFRVPAATIQSQVDAFVADGYRLREAIYRVFTSDDFVRF